MTATIEAPLLTGMRAEARALVAASQLPDDLSDAVVELDAHKTLAATPSFADELVCIILLERGARQLRVGVAGSNLTRWLRESADEHDVGSRLVTRLDPAARQD